MPQRLAMVRDGKAAEVLGWILVGFLFGAACALAVMLHARRPAQAPAPEEAASAPAATVVYTPPPAPRALLTPPARGAAFAAAPVAPPPATFRSPSTTTADDAPAAPMPERARPRREPARPSPGPDAQVEEDAAATGMTSRSAGDPGG